MNKHTNIQNKIVYKGKFINVRIDTIERDGLISEKEVVEAKKGVIIAFVSDDKKILLIKQYRHNRGEIYELPAGGMKDNETPLRAAKREILEETGIQAKQWKLISAHENGVHQEGVNYYFLARGYVNKTRQSLDADEYIDYAKFYSFQQIASLMRRGKIPCLRTRACIWLTKLTLQNDWAA